MHPEHLAGDHCSVNNEGDLFFNLLYGTRMVDLQTPLRDNVRLLGQLLGNTINSDLGPEFVEKIEKIRHLAKDARHGEGYTQDLIAALSSLEEHELVPMARAFSQFLNLANLAEEHHRIRRRNSLIVTKQDPDAFDQVFQYILAQNIDPDTLVQKAAEIQVELVFTAHPTEANRRTFIQKYDAMAESLARLDRELPLSHAYQDTEARLQRLISEAWHTNAIVASVQHRSMKQSGVLRLSKTRSGERYPSSCIILIVSWSRSQVSGYPGMPLQSGLLHGWGETVMAIRM